MNDIFFCDKLRMKVDENNVVPDSEWLYGVNPYKVPKVYLAGLGNIDPERGDEWNKDFVVLVNGNRILEVMQEDFIEAFTTDKDGNGIWVDKRTLPGSKDWEGAKFTRYRAGKEYMVTEYDLETFEKKKYKMVPEGTSKFDSWDKFWLGKLLEGEIIDDRFVVNNGVLKQYLRQYRRQDSDLIIPNSVVAVGEEAFSQPYYFESISIPESLTSIPETFFEHCRAKHIEVPKENTRYYTENGCLIDRQTATLVLAYAGTVIPDDGSVNKIGPNAFCWQSDLQSVVIPDSVTEITNGAFSCCYRLKEISIPTALENKIEDIFGKTFVKKEDKWIAQEKETST